MEIEKGFVEYALLPIDFKVTELSKGLIGLWLGCGIIGRNHVEIIYFHFWEWRWKSLKGSNHGVSFKNVGPNAGKIWDGGTNDSVIE